MKFVNETNQTYFQVSSTNATNATYIYQYKITILAKGVELKYLKTPYLLRLIDLLSHPDPDIRLRSTHDITTFLFIYHVSPPRQDQNTINDLTMQPFSFILWLHLSLALDCLRTLRRDQAIRSSPVQ